MIVFLIGLLLLIDQGNHGALMRQWLDEHGIEYAYYEIGDDSVAGIEAGLKFANEQGYQVVALPWQLFGEYPGVVREMETAYSRGATVYICSGYIAPIDSVYLPLAVITSAVNDIGEKLPGIDYSQTEQYWPGCSDQIGCSNSLATVRAAAGQ